MSDSDFENLVTAVADATRTAVHRLFAEHPGRFYYITLWVFEGVAPPRLSAWSWEALESRIRIDSSASGWAKWSYADSPYCNFADEAFLPVDKLLATRPNLYDMDEAGFEAEAEARTAAYEEAIRRLDGEGLFGIGDARLNVALMVEVMPPDFTNIGRARRLNPSEAIDEWLAEAAE
jgi:hypothetical protein